MSSLMDLKNEIINKINSADDKLLRMIIALVDSYQQEESGLSQIHKDILDKRLKFHEGNPNIGKSWAELKDSLMKEYDL